MLLWKPSGVLRGRTRKSVALSLPRLPEKSGGTYGITAFVRDGDVSVHGRSSVFTRVGESGFQVIFHFCPDCGSTVFPKPQRVPELTAVAAGAFAHPNFPKPANAVHLETRHPWVADL